MTEEQEEVLEGLRAGRVLRIDRRDAPLLPWLLELQAKGKVDSEFVEVDEQSSYIRFWWVGGDSPDEEE